MKLYRKAQSLTVDFRLATVAMVLIATTLLFVLLWYLSIQPGPSGLAASPAFNIPGYT